MSSLYRFRYGYIAFLVYSPPMTPGTLIRTMRERHGLTQRQLATRAGTTQSAISRIEHDHVSPTIETLSELAFLMGEEIVLEPKPYEWGHDIDLIRSNMDLTTEQRIQQNKSIARFVRQARDGLKTARR